MKKNLFSLLGALLITICFNQVAQAFVFAYEAGDPLLPAGSYHISQYFGQYNSDFSKYHLGEDRNRGTCNDDYGDNVYSIANGTVTYAQNAGSSWGNVVIVQHILLPSFTAVNSLYGHLDSINVYVGQDVSIGQKIGEMGDADGYYDCAHLHFEIRNNSSLNTTPGPGYATWSDPLWYYYEDPSDFISAY